MKGDGDFRSGECVEFLKQADIVVTNPPFSLFREYIAHLVEHDKNFIVMGNMNTACSKNIIPLIQNNKIWYGPSLCGRRIWFGVPDHYPLTGPDTMERDGMKFVKVKGVIRWITNLDHRRRHEDLFLFRKYKAKDYPKYINYDAIHVGYVKDIPIDYAGVMGVPITFLDRFNPDQFEIVDFLSTPKVKLPSGEIKTKYKRFLVRNRHPETSASKR